MSRVVFLEEEHIYLNKDGIIIPSVTELVNYAYPNGYSDVPKHILRKKAIYGKKVHETIEDYINGKIDMDKFHFSRIDPNIKSALNQYMKLEQTHPLLKRVTSVEQIVDYKQRFAGMYDLLTKDGYLVDIKTTSTLHKDWVSLQLGLYYLALGINNRIGYCAWIPKSSPGELIEIEVWNEQRCIELLESYEKEHSAEY